MMKFHIDIALYGDVNPWVWSDEALNEQNEKVIQYNADKKLWDATYEAYKKAMEKFEDDLRIYNE